MVEIVQRLNWEKFAVVYVDDTYGQEGFKAIVSEADNGGLCIAQAVKLRASETSQNVLEGATRQLLASGMY